MSTGTNPPPSYLTWDAEREAWYLRFRYVDTAGRVHWPRERSPWPRDETRSRRWARGRRGEVIAQLEDEASRIVGDSATPLTLGEVLDRYEADCRERGTRWVGSEDYRAEVIRATLGAATPARDLGPAEITSWRSRLRETRGIAPRTLNAYVSLLKAAMNYAVRLELLPANPMGRIRKLPETLRTPPALSERQVGALLAALDPWERAATAQEDRRRRPRVPLRTRVMLGYYTGGRPEALEVLTWSAVDLVRGVVRYRSKGHDVICPLPAPLLAYLRRIHAANRPAPSKRIIPSGPGTARLHNWRTRWSQLIRLANASLRDEPIPETTPLHALRHSRISHLLLAGVSPQVVVQIVGTSLEMLRRHYAHLMTRSLEEELARASEHPALASLDGVSVGGQKTGQRNDNVLVHMASRGRRAQKT